MVDIDGIDRVDGLTTLDGWGNCSVTLEGGRECKCQAQTVAAVADVVRRRRSRSLKWA